MPRFHIPNMSCGHCKATVEKTIHALDPAAQIEFDMAAREIVTDTKTETKSLQSALSAAGYDATLSAQ